MIHKIQNIKITDKFSTTVEITGNTDSKKAIFFSHGFGVERDARGMFTDIENILKNDFLCIRFDYNQIKSNGDMTVKPYEFMKNTLDKMITIISNEYSSKKKFIIAHSMGNVITGLLNPKDFKSIILLAPPILAPYDGLIKYFKSRPNTKINLESDSTIKRSDGTITTIGKQFLEDMKNTNPLELYEKLSKSTKLSIIHPTDNSIIKDSYKDISKLPNINIIDMHGDHDFSGESRIELLSNIRKLLI